MRYAAVTIGCACTGYLAIFAAVFGGLQESTGENPPRMDEPLPSSSSQKDSDVPAGAQFPARSESPGANPSPKSSQDQGRDPSPSPTAPATSSARPGGANR
ncbi:hypothetical protein H181DRAFT_04749 [Streptomyces sp. WMMB 714]|uniref:Uncharacterized protein n=1 Tax=Streptomyces daqingensis TaxID=1472640 RepID=A0ABQ2ML38_9ACTN|nr:hypothetical protein [Streptomyces daqingensis]GGO54328.1 hypothetical protein GCM10012287_43020 [Streptomyces daqingensis]SCK52151.1 hypothetical protein H181DRAFT_04749 [Streptomyces sp. WMMB 714]